MGKQVAIRTNVSIKEAAAAFQQAMRVSWLSEFKGQGTQFVKPPSDDAFGDLDDDQPDFEVMAILGGGGSEWQKSGIQMYVWDRGASREIQLVTGKNLLALGMKAASKLRKFVEAIRMLDPAAEVHGLV
jgi:hypothetical protein